MPIVNVEARIVFATRTATAMRTHAFDVDGGAATLIAIEPARRAHGMETRLVALLGLTPAEARVACEVGNGLNPKDVAAAPHTLPSTVRMHRHHVFETTATRRRADLMWLIAQLAIARSDCLRIGIANKNGPRKTPCAGRSYNA